MSTTQNILIVGNPGVGKTWVMLRLLDFLGCQHHAQYGLIRSRTNVDAFSPENTKHRRTHIIGSYDGTVFQGSDRLSMAVMRDVPGFLKLLEGKSNGIFEGDRFMNKNFLAAAAPYIIKIDGTGEEGRAQRGSQQSERQLKALSTRVRNIKETILVKDSQECFYHIINRFYEEANEEV